MIFEDKYKNIKQIVQEELDYIENFMVQCVNTREPLNSHIINFLTSPSKRIRPLVSILFYKSLYKKIDKNQLKALSAVEIIHNASLIHDDIIDESDKRRGLDTISKKFGNKLGVICGDYLLSVAMNIATGLDSIELLKNFSNTLNKMCIGEIDQNFNKFKIGTIEDYIEKSKNKTAYLFETAILSPFFVNKLNNQIASNLGINVGISFQIRDDLLNLLQLDKSKPTNNDIKEGIYNAPVIYAGSSEKYLDGVEKTKNLLNNYVSKSLKCIEKFENNKYTFALKNLLELLKYEQE